MSNFDWQTGIAIAVVAVAAVTLMRRIYGTIQGSAKSSCGSGGCGSCSANSPSDQTGNELPLVTLNSTSVGDHSQSRDAN